MKDRKKKRGFEEVTSDDDLEGAPRGLSGERIKKRKTAAEYDIDVKLKENEKPSLILYKYRWVVLAAYFMSSAATGAVTGSLSTNRKIYEKVNPSITKSLLDIAKYSDLVLYFPMTFLALWIIENKGLKICINFGCFIMIAGSILRFCGAFNLWIWYFGHMLCMSS